MKRIIKLFLFTIIQLQFLFATPLEEEFAKHFHEGKYNGRTIGRCVLALGKPTYSYEYVVNEEYMFLTEKEPDYWKYFSEQELKSGVKIRYYIWKKGKGDNTNWTEAWAKKEKNKWVVFDSMWYDSTIEF